MFLSLLYFVFVIILASGYGFSRRGIVDEAAVQSAPGFVQGLVATRSTSIIVLIPLLSFGYSTLCGVAGLDAKQLMLLILSAAPVFSVEVGRDLGYDMSSKVRLILQPFRV